MSGGQILPLLVVFVSELRQMVVTGVWDDRQPQISCAGAWFVSGR